MKKFSILVLLSVFAFTKFSNAQKDAKAFEGQVSYSIEYLGEIDPATKAQAPTEIIQYYKGTKIRIEQITAMGKVVIISDNASKEQIVLIDMMGNKWAIKSTKEETEKTIAESPKATVKIGTESKTIAGVKCLSAEVTLEDKTETFWFASDLNIDKPNWNMPWSEINGILMEYTQSQGDISSKVVAKEVKKGKIKDTQFEIPSDYQQMSTEEFKNMFGGGE